MIIKQMTVLANAFNVIKRDADDQRLFALHSFSLASLLRYERSCQFLIGDHEEVFLSEDRTFSISE